MAGWTRGGGGRPGKRDGCAGSAPSCSRCRRASRISRRKSVTQVGEIRATRALPGGLPREFLRESPQLRTEVLMRQLRRTAGIVLLILSAGLGGLENGLLGLCGPFTDVTDAIFCPFVLEIFYLGITTGTTATTFAPADNVTRLQMAAFLSRTVDGVLRRGSRRAAVNKLWNARGVAALGLTTIASSPHRAATDGQDIWVTSGTSGMVSRVRAGDGKLLETITGVTAAQGVLSAMGRILVTGLTGNTLYRIDPTQTGGAVTAVTTNLGASPDGIAFDGLRIWTANGSGSVSIVTPGAAIPWTVTTVTSGFFNPTGALYDGANVWITDSSAGRLQKLDASGAILQSV